MHRTTPLIAALLLIAPAAAPAQAPADSPAQTMRGMMAAMTAAGPIVTLSVTESVDAAPDMATVNTGVETRAPTAKAAMAQNATKMDALIAALVKAGIDRKDIQTSGINLNPQYDYSNRQAGEGPRFLGYQANNMLNVVIRKIDKAGDVVDAMVNAGATNINGPVLGIADPGKLEAEARAKAVKTGQARADFYAQATGFKSARLLDISETGDFARPIETLRVTAAAAMAPAPATKIEGGQLSTSVTLNFRYMLER